MGAADYLKRLGGKFRVSNDVRRIFPNSAWQAGEKILKLVFGVLIVAVVARYLGPGNFGTLNVAIAFVAVWSALSTMGMHEIGVKELVTYPEENGEVITCTLLLQLIGGVLVLVLATGTSFMIEVDHPSFSCLVAIISAAHLFRSTTAFKYWFDARLESRYVAIIEVLAFVMVSLVRISLVLSEADLIYFGIAILLESVFFAAGMTYVYLRRTDRPVFDIRKFTTLKRLISTGWPIALSGLAITIYMRIDQIMLGAISGVEAAGIYSAAVRFSEVWYFFPVVVASSSFPVLLEIRGRDYALYEHKIQRLYSLLTLVAVFVAVSMTLLSGWIVHFLLGSDYSATATVLALHVWNGIFVTLGIVSVKYMVGENLEKLILLLTVLGVIMNIGLNMILIPRYGPIGAATATLISQAMITIVFDALVPKLRRNFIMKLRALLFRELV